jgi:hypothetical protein
MDGEKEKLAQLAEKVDELVSVLSRVTDELHSISASLRSLAPPSPAVPLQPTPIVQAPERKKALEDVRLSFPEDLESLLTFEEKGDYIIVKPRQFLGSENFAKVASTVRGMGGEYISAGRDSHFRILKKKT